MMMTMMTPSWAHTVRLALPVTEPLGTIYGTDPTVALGPHCPWHPPVWVLFVVTSPAHLYDSVRPLIRLVGLLKQNHRLGGINNMSSLSQSPGG